MLLRDNDLLRKLWERELPPGKIPKDASGRLLNAYLDLYSERWSAPEVARALARIPGVFTWDDHEIMDGWGSYSDSFQTAPGPQLVWRAARRAFELVQLGVLATLRYPPFQDAELPRGLPAGTAIPAKDGPSILPHFLQALSFNEPDGELHVVILDLRTERSDQRVMAEEGQWEHLEAWLKGLEAHVRKGARLSRKRHLVIVSSIPLVFLSGAFPEWILKKFVPGGQEYEDDLRDQWESPAHSDERERLVGRLFAAAKACNCRVTVLSGDVHVGSKAELVSKQKEHSRGNGDSETITQLVASGMVHPAPGWLAALFEEFAQGVQGGERVGHKMRGRLLPFSERGFVFERNFLEIRPDDLDSQNPNTLRGRLHARWVVEGGALQDDRVTLEP